MAYIRYSFAKLITITFFMFQQHKIHAIRLGSRPRLFYTRTFKPMPNCLKFKIRFVTFMDHS